MLINRVNASIDPSGLLANCIGLCKVLDPFSQPRALEPQHSRPYIDRHIYNTNCVDKAGRHFGSTESTLAFVPNF